MIDTERIEQLIDFQKQNLRQMESVARMMGGGPVIEMTMQIGKPLVEDTIKALEEYRDMRTVKGIIEG